ncbi:MAG: hypothetical protein GY814_09820 [Gammaproteobacteria bacterium]|nr:hypothetical protein [Gammaproteobacteria bacterium]
MADTPSFDDLFLIGKAEQIVNRPDLQVLEGDVSEMLLMAAAAMADKCVEDSARRFRATYVDGAAGDELTQLASDHWALVRFDAVKSTGSVEFSRSDDAAGAGVVAAGTVLATQPDVNGLSLRYILDTDVNFGLADTGPLVGTVTAEIEGIGGNVLSDTVTRVVDNLFDSSITATNPSVMVGGSESETDAELRERVREFPATLSKGTLASLEYGAKQVPSVKNTTAVEELGGGVTVYVADASGNASASMVAAVVEELINWRCAGTVITVEAGVPLLHDVEYTLTVRTGTNVLALTPIIAASIEGLMNSLKIGETLYLSAIQTAIRNVDPVNITEAVISLPAANQEPSAFELIRPGTITRIV